MTAASEVVGVSERRCDTCPRLGNLAEQLETITQLVNDGDTEKALKAVALSGQIAEIAMTYCSLCQEFRDLTTTTVANEAAVAHTSEPTVVGDADEGTAPPEEVSLIDVNLPDGRQSEPTPMPTDNEEDRHVGSLRSSREESQAAPMGSTEDANYQVTPEHRNTKQTGVEICMAVFTDRPNEWIEPKDLSRAIMVAKGGTLTAANLIRTKALQEIRTHKDIEWRGKTTTRQYRLRVPSTVESAEEDNSVNNPEHNDKRLEELTDWGLRLVGTAEDGKDTYLVNGHEETFAPRLSLLIRHLLDYPDGVKVSVLFNALRSEDDGFQYQTIASGLDVLRRKLKPYGLDEKVWSNNKQECGIVGISPKDDNKDDAGGRDFLAR